MNPRQYWFTEDAATVAQHLDRVHGSWMKWSSNPVVQAWVRNTISYYSNVLEPASWETSLTYEGEQGELVKMLVPEARQLVRQFVSLITKQRLAFQAVAMSRGSDVAQETRLGNGLGNQIVEDQRLDSKGERLAELACVLGVSYMKSTWRSDRGSPQVAQGEGVLYNGDLEMTVLSPFDVFFDYQIEEWDQLDWVEVRTMKSRWSLIAQFPDLESEILALPTTREWNGPQTSSYDGVGSDDLVFCYEVFHKPTPAVPQGRMLMYSDDKTIYYDGPNKYGCIPIEQCKPEPIMGMGLGYPMFSNLLPAQEMMDHSFSAIATNQAAFAVQNVTVARGAAIGVQAINGMNFISFTPQNVPGGGKPEALQLTQSAPETFKFADLLRDRLTGLSNLNSAIRGQPPAGVTSGAAIATLTSNALEFVTSFSKAWTECLERSLMHGINAYRKFAEIPHLVRMVGKNFQAFNREFVGKDLDPIQGMKLTMSNPMLMTIAGRESIADKCLKSGLVKSMQEYFSILEGAPVQQLYQTELSENDLMQSENDALMDGQPVIALSTDDHAAHIRSHCGLLNDPAVRFNNKRVKEILNHVIEHETLAKDTDPFLLAMVRTGKMPDGGPPPPEGAMPPGPGLPPPPGGVGQPAQPATDKLNRGGEA